MPLAEVALEIVGGVTAALMVIVRVLVSVPKPLIALIETLVLPAEIGVPEIAPVCVLIVRPAGRFVALNEVGAFDAAITKVNAALTVPLTASALVIKGTAVAIVSV